MNPLKQRVGEDAYYEKMKISVSGWTCILTGSLRLSRVHEKFGGARLSFKLGSVSVKRG